jgi:excinuclease UvrABC nuclease subunit
MKWNHQLGVNFITGPGKGQLSAAVEAFRSLGIEPPTLISLAKQEEGVFRPGESAPLQLSRTSAALRLLAVSCGCVPPPPPRNSTPWAG